MSSRPRRSSIGFAFLCIAVLVPGGIVAAQPAKIVSLTFDGNTSVDSARLRGQFPRSRPGSIYNPEELRMEASNLQRFYQDRGFLQATIGLPAVEIRTDAVKGQVALVRIPVFEGPVYTVGQIGVENVKAFEAATLLQICPLAKGQPYSRRKIAEWQDKIAEGYHEMGYIRFASSVREDINEDGHVVNFTLACKEGNPYSVGKITIEGDDAINRSDFRRHLLLGEGGVYNPEMLYLSLQFLNQMNTYRPISGSDVDVKIDDSKSTVDLVFHLVLNKHPRK